MPVLTRRVKVHAVQRAFCRSAAVFRGFVGGRGAGKSWVGAYDLLRRSKPGRLYQAAAPTYPMLKDATWRTLLGLATELGFVAAVNRSDLRLTLHTGAEIIGRSADDPERMRGPNLSGIWLDEAGQMPAEAFDVGIACLREAGEQGWMSATFTPRGRQHWTYKVFASGRPDTELFHATTGDNPFLPPSFEGTIRAQYTAVYAAQELGGEFVDASGGQFDRAWVKLVTASPATAARVRYWDTAATEGGGAFTAGVLMARGKGGRYCIEDVVRGQWSAANRHARMLATAQADRKRGVVVQWVEQEPGGSGKEAAEATARLLAGYIVRADRVTGDKVTRFQPFAAQAEAGNVDVLDAPWADDYLAELNAFPEGPYKDQADATSGAFNKLAGVPGDTSVTLPKPADRNVVAGMKGVFRTP